MRRCGLSKKYIIQKLLDSAENTIVENPGNISEEVKETLSVFLNKIRLTLIGL